MPILRQEPSQFPKNLFEDSGDFGGDRQWWVLYTKARQEKSLARDLTTHQIPFFLPLVKKTIVQRGRKRQSFLPLFVGYVFLFGNEQDRVRALATNRVSRALAVDDQARLTHNLRQLKRLIDCDAPLTVESRLEPGRRVRVTQGSLMGLEGTVLIRRDSVRLLIAVDFLQQGASIEIEDSLLEPAE